MISILIIIISYGVKLLSWAIVADAILSWIPSYNETVYRIRCVLQKITYPIMEPVRRLISPLTMRIGIDLSPIVGIFALELIANIFIRILWIIRL
ncbi:MAG: YggT family protein [Clostridia bacterium]|nr:YggT family protein [Clostridia bacterium]